MTEAPGITIDGKWTEPTKETFTWMYGADHGPSCMLEENGMEVCVWHLAWSYIGNAHSNIVIKFDRNGNFVPLEEIPPQVNEWIDQSCPKHR